MTTWQEILKMPYIQWQDLQEPYADSVKARGTRENPMVFIDDASPLPGEEFDNQYMRYYAGKGYGQKDHKTFDYDENDEMSSLGRVRINGKIVKPELTKYGLGVFLTGKLTHYKQNRYKSKYGGKTRTYERPRGSMIPWKITVQYCLDNNINIPDNAPIWLSGTESGTYGEWKAKQNQKGNRE
tara:strand:- start:3498 stop:4046 length:549 start_codon:yes stop_codon:yes gene_type:complete